MLLNNCQLKKYKFSYYVENPVVPLQAFFIDPFWKTIPGGRWHVWHMVRRWSISNKCRWAQKVSKNSNAGKWIYDNDHGAPPAGKIVLSLERQVSKEWAVDGVDWKKLWKISQKARAPRHENGGISIFIWSLFGNGSRNRFWFSTRSALANLSALLVGF